MALRDYVHAHDSVHWFLSDLCAKVVAKSGVPTDIYHLGKIMLQSFIEAPDFVNQIDGATDESETNASVMERSIRCAIAFRKLGFVTNDVITIMAPNHLDVAVAFYAALYLGLPMASVDVNLGAMELGAAFQVNRPKLILCQSEKSLHIQNVLKNCNLNALIITFDKCEGFLHFGSLLEINSGDENNVQEFKANDFDPAETIAIIAATSGTTGLPKSAALTHKNLRISVPYNWLSFEKYPSPTQMVIVSSPLQWLSAGFNYLYSSILRYTRLQSSKPMYKEDYYSFINKYRPTCLMITPTLARMILAAEDVDRCDFSSVVHILLGGSAISQTIIDDVKRIIPQAMIVVLYGLSEVGGFVFYDAFPAKSSLGRPIGCLSYRLIDVDSGEDIKEPNVPGELWLKGPTTFKGYYNNPEATAEIYEDGWIKTGDMLYRDEHWNYYYVERLKQLLKYKNHQVSPSELEDVIKQHPGVYEVAVTGIPDLESGDLPVACVIPKPGYTVTAQEIKDLVKDTLTDSKQLRGGVAFVTEIPMTATTKINRRKLKELAPTLKRE